MFIILLFFFLSVISAQKRQLTDLTSDTLFIELQGHSSLSDLIGIGVVDNRNTKGQVIGAYQITKWLYIPVDRYLVLPDSLATVFSTFLSGDVPTGSSQIVIDHLTIWENKKLMFGKRWMLNAYTRFVNDKGETIEDWQWEFRAKKHKKNRTDEIIGQLLFDWMTSQKKVLLTSRIKEHPISPHPYRRQLMMWLDTIFLKDGYILDGRLSLDFPADRMRSYIRGSPGIYYRKSSLHESIAIGGKDQQWYYRLNSSWLGRLNVTGRFGFNSFNTDKFDYVDWWNVFLVNIGFTAGIEYRPVYHKGIFAGAGLHQSVNILPDVVNRYDTGLLLTIGMVLP